MNNSVKLSKDIWVSFGRIRVLINIPKDHTSDNTLYVFTSPICSPWICLGAMYNWQPMFVFAKNLSSCPDTPKSHSFVSRFWLINTFVGFTSYIIEFRIYTCIYISCPSLHLLSVFKRGRDQILPQWIVCNSSLRNHNPSTTLPVTQARTGLGTLAK
jgi:hypothetical protein